MEEVYEAFKNELPERGCYSNLEANSTNCYDLDYYYFGYQGSSKLPLGYGFSIVPWYIGNVNVRANLGFYHKFDLNGNYDIDGWLSTWKVFANKGKVTDSFVYNYRRRFLDFVDTAQTFQNHGQSERQASTRQNSW